MYFALPYWRYGTLPESSHESFRGHRAGLTPVHDDLPPAPLVLQEVEQSKHTSQDVAQPLRSPSTVCRRPVRPVAFAHTFTAERQAGFGS
jgi:hypothetical protein